MSNAASSGPLARLREWTLRLRSLWRPRRRDADLTEELDLHLDLATDELRRRGLSAREAARLARVRHGSPVAALEMLRAQQGVAWLAAFWMDAKLGLRMLRRSWGVTLVGGAAIALVIGIAASVFSVLDRVEGSALPLEEGDRLVAIQPYDPVSRGELDTSLEDFQRWRTRLRSVVGVGAYRTITNLFLAVPSGSYGRVSVAAMTAQAFELARVAPILGRGLQEDDERDGAERVVVVAYGVWQSLFSADPEVLGQRIQLDDEFYTVVGVMPEGFAFPVNHRFWIPLRTDPLAYPQGSGPEVFVIARLAPGVAIQTARAEVATMGLLPSVARPGISEEVRTRVVPYAYTFTDQIRDHRWEYRLALVLIGLLLIPPSANIAILLYARNVTRSDEFAARYVLGASRGRIVAQLFVESLVLALLGAGVGLLLAREALARFQMAVDQELGSTMPFWMDFTLSFRALPLVAGLAVMAALIAGVVPALCATSRWKQSELHGLGNAAGRRLGKTWTTLVAAQVAVTTALVPVVGAMTWLDVRPILHGRGFPVEEYLSARLEVAASSLADGRIVPRELGARLGEAQAELVRRLKAEPGIRGVSLSSSFGPDGGRWAEVEEVGPGPEGPFRVRHHQVDASFFDLFQIQLLGGRDFVSEEFEHDRAGVIVNRTFANDILGSTSPLGRKVRYLRGGPAPEIERSYEIVGVVEDLPPNTGIRRVYHPMRPGQAPYFFAALHVGPTMEPGAARRIWEVATSVDPALTIRWLRAMGATSDQDAFINRAQQLAPAAAALIVLLFSVAGIHTLTAFTVATRTREIGIRSALGAHPRRVVLELMRRALAPVAFGSACGLLGAGLISIFLSRAMDEMAIGGILGMALAASMAGLLLVACAAAVGPARRALRIDVTEALRDG